MDTRKATTMTSKAVTPDGLTTLPRAMGAQLSWRRTPSQALTAAMVSGMEPNTMKKTTSPGKRSH